MTPEEYAKSHQKAFRVAFDFLNTHFPPIDDDGWWIQSAKDIADVNVKAGGGKLVTELLNAVYTYIGYEYQQRRDQSG